MCSGRDQARELEKDGGDEGEGERPKWVQRLKPCQEKPPFTETAKHDYSG